MNFFKRTLIILQLCLVICTLCKAQAYKNPKLPVSQRVADLLKRMTLEEKIGQMSMSGLDGRKEGNIGYGVLASPFVSAEQVIKHSIESKKYYREQTRLGIPPIQIDFNCEI